MVKIKEPDESLWVHLRDRELLYREEQLSRCLVGCFGDSFESIPPLSSLKGWMLVSWILGEGGKGFKNPQVGWGSYTV